MVKVVILNVFYVYRLSLALEEEDSLETLALNWIMLKVIIVISCFPK